MTASAGPVTDAPTGTSVPQFDRLCDTGGILVTGSHRSGTTWVGKMLATAPRVEYIHEPFKPGWSLPYTFTRAETWFQHIGAHNETEWKRQTLRTLQFGFSWKHAWRNDPRWSQLWPITRRWFSWNRRRSRGYRPLIKDPIALFAAPWLADRFGVAPVVMIRHPAAFASSIKVKNWVFDWTQWSGQKELMDGLLAPFRDEIARKETQNDDIIDQAILQWRVFHHVIDAYRTARPGWLFVRHEDLSLDPAAGFKRMFEQLKLDWTPHAEETIRTSSEEGNLKDAAVAGKSTQYVQLDAKANIRNWQKRLSAEEISRIRKGTEDVASKFYADEDW